jgi:hypothetical protein
MMNKKTNNNINNSVKKNQENLFASNKKINKIAEEFEVKKYELEIKRLQELHAMEADMDLENRESNRNRARSITVGTAFGGTTEVMMRSDGGRHIWCTMQPVEVIELIHQLAANVGCHIALKPRDDFGSWRDWRISEAEKQHLNGFPPFANDMAVFQKLGASGFDQQKVQQLMDFISKQQPPEYSEVDGDKKEEIRKSKKIIGRRNNTDGAPNIMIGEDDGEIYNKRVNFNENEFIYMQGGDGGFGKSYGGESSSETMVSNENNNLDNKNKKENSFNNADSNLKK